MRWSPWFHSNKENKPDENHKQQISKTKIALHKRNLLQPPNKSGGKNYKVIWLHCVYVY